MTDDETPEPDLHRTLDELVAVARRIAARVRLRDHTRPLGVGPQDDRGARWAIVSG